MCKFKKTQFYEVPTIMIFLERGLVCSKVIFIRNIY